MLVQICRAADAEKRWCYLETGLAVNVGLYIKHGFITVATSQAAPEAPVMELMGRPPQ